MFDRKRTVDEFYTFMNRVLHKNDLEEVQQEDLILILKNGTVVICRINPVIMEKEERLRLVKLD